MDLEQPDTPPAEALTDASPAGSSGGGDEEMATYVPVSAAAALEGDEGAADSGAAGFIGPQLPPAGAAAGGDSDVFDMWAGQVCGDSWHGGDVVRHLLLSCASGWHNVLALGLSNGTEALEQKWIQRASSVLRADGGRATAAAAAGGRSGGAVPAEAGHRAGRAGADSLLRHRGAPRPGRRERDPVLCGGCVPAAE